jgi:hypothetical protein
MDAIASGVRPASRRGREVRLIASSSSTRISVMAVGVVVSVATCPYNMTTRYTDPQLYDIAEQNFLYRVVDRNIAGV